MITKSTVVQQISNETHTYTCAFLSYGFRQFADPKRQGGIGYRLCIHESYQWSRHQCFKTFLWGFSCLWVKLVSVYMATSARHSTKACASFLIKLRGSSKKKMLILFFKPIPSSIYWIINIYCQHAISCPIQSFFTYSCPFEKVLVQRIMTKFLRMKYVQHPISDNGSSSSHYPTWFSGLETCWNICSL